MGFGPYGWILTTTYKKNISIHNTINFKCGPEHIQRAEGAAEGGALVAIIQPGKPPQSHHRSHHR